MGTGTVETEELISTLRTAAGAIRSVTTSPLDEIKAIHAARNALEAREADLLAVMDETKAHEADGAASVSTWAARELLQDAKTTKQMIRSAHTMAELPLFAAAHHAGVICGEHVNALTYGLKHVGHGDTIDLEEDLLTVATQKTPREVFELLRTCTAIKHADQLDESWLRGMDKQDFQCTPVGDGFHVKGFLPIDVGAKLKAFLTAKAVPIDGDDTRTAAQRRVDALDQLITGALNSDDLPTQNTVTPHLSVIVDASTLKDALNQAATGGTPTTQPPLLESTPAILEGFGPIGPALLAYLAYGAELTPILIDGITENQKILDVGRTSRIATKKQRRAIHYRQKGTCANPGCHHPIGEIHHILNWLHGGTTNLDNLVGLCRKCHALITIGRLTMTGTHETGHTFTPTRAGPLARTG
jgi:hypothetical protein